VKPRLVYIDTATFSLPQLLHKDAAEFVADVLKDAKKPYLETKIRATHSGQLILGRCYSGRGMKNGTGSWYSVDRGGSSAFDKPILKNHDAEGEPLGRVYSASYTQLKTGKDWDEDWIRPDTGLKHGSGYISIVGHVFDMDAIPKILDGRYNTVSTSQAPKTVDDAWCSYCRTPLARGCEHPIGSYVEADDGTEYLVYMATGDLEYSEVSYVNKPRQQNAVTLSSRMINDSDTEVHVIETVNGDAGPFEGFSLGSDQSEQMVDLLSDKLPSTERVTGKVKVSMATKQKKRVDGAPPAAPREGSNAGSNPEAVAATPAVDQTTEDQEAAQVLKPLPADIGFLSLANYFNAKGWLDMETDFKDGLYVYGITDKAGGHAHTFTGYANAKQREFSGSTGITGQGSTAHDHQHSIWIDKVDMGAEAIDGMTRDASYGPSHTHKFSASIRGDSQSHATLILDVDSVKEALRRYGEIDTDSLTDADKEKLLDPNSEKIAWSKSMLDAANPLLGRLKSEFRDQVVREILDAGLLGESSSNEMDTKVLEQAIKGLTDRAADLEKSLSAANEKLALLEQEKTKLVADNATLTSSVEGVRKSVTAKFAAALKALSESSVLDLTNEKAVKDATSPLEEKSVSDLDAVVGDLLKQLPDKMKLTAKSIVSEARREAPTALEDKTNQEVAAETGKGSSAKTLSGLIDQADAIDRDV